MTYQTILDKLNSCQTADDLIAYADWLYASNALDESEQTTMIGYRGPLAPWSAPDDAEEIWSNGEDAIVRLASGNLAAWSNMDRAWSEPDEDDERLPLISPTFETIGEYPAGVYSAQYLNPPSGSDCTHVLVRDDGALGWCDSDGDQSEDSSGNVSTFSVEDLTSAE